MQNAISINFSDFVQVQNNNIITTSEFIAKAFKKEHKNILAKIDEILSQVPDYFGKLNFKPTEKSTKNNLGFTVKNRVYELTKDGFMLLVMGFTGKQAMQIKIAYIEAFNAMAEKLQKENSGIKTIEHKAKLPNNYLTTLAKMLHYANEFRVIQSMLSENLNSEKSRELLTSIHCNIKNNNSGYLFVFKPDISNDIQAAENLLYAQSQKVT